MTPEQAAAKRCLDDPLRDVTSLDDSDLAAFIVNATEVARAYLAEHDETPVAGDEQWMREQGFVNKVTPNGEDDIFRLGYVQWGRNSRILFVGTLLNNCIIKLNPTRGDVLRLLSVVEKDGE